MYQRSHQQSENLILIIKSNNCLRLKHALQTDGTNVNAVARHGIRPIQQAVMQGSVTLVQILIDAGADIEVTRDDGSTLVHLAVLVGDVDLVRLLLNAGCDPCRADERGEIPLFNAVNMGDLKICRELLKFKSPVMHCDNVGNTVFHLLALGGKPHELSKLLIETLYLPTLGLTQANSFGRCPIEVAVATNSASVLDQFLGYMALSRLRTSFRRLLEHAVRNGSGVQIINVLIDHGYDYKAELSSLDLPSLWVTAAGGEETLEYLSQLKSQVPSLFYLARVRLWGLMESCQTFVNLTRFQLDSPFYERLLQLPKKSTTSQ